VRAQACCREGGEPRRPSAIFLALLAHAPTRFGAVKRFRHHEAIATLPGSTT
jgi:hypothetical protein